MSFRLIQVVQISLTALLLSPNIVLLLAGSYADSSSHEQLVISTMLAILVQLIFFAIIGNVVWALILQLPFLMWLPIEIVYSWRYQEPSGTQVFHVLLETTWSEVFGYLGSAFWVYIFGLYVIILIGILLSSVRCGITLTYKVRCFIIVVCGGYLIVNGMLIGRVNKEMESARLIFVGESGEDKFLARQLPGGLDQYLNTYPFGMLLRFSVLAEQYKNLKTTTEELSRYKTTYIKKKANEREIYVVVIGESSRADHWQLNGYARETNPLLAKRKNLLSFNNAFSAGNLTRISVPALLSRSSASDILNSNLKPSWISDFRQAGFDVVWISMQSFVGSHDTAINSYALLSDRQYFLNKASAFSSQSLTDGSILPTFEHELSQNSMRQLYILHTLGSHTPYKSRYTEAFSYFKPDVYESIFDVDSISAIRNSYDNSIRYTDYVLNRIIELVDKQDAQSFILYISDHGQTFIDEGCLAAGHGFDAIQNYHVPMLFWWSEKFYQNNQSLVMSSIENKKNFFSTHDFYELILHWAGFWDDERFSSIVKGARDDSNEVFYRGLNDCR